MKTIVSLISFLFLINHLHAITYPDKRWMNKTPAEVGLNQAKFGKFINYVMSDEENYRTNALVVIKDGYLVYEGYKRGFDSNKLHRLWSVSKTIGGLITGIAIDEGHLQKTTEVANFYPKLLKSKFSTPLKIEDLLHMASGLDWNEGYESNPLSSDVVKMLYSAEEATEDMASYTASRSQKFEPGTRHYYSSGETNLMMGVLKQILASDYIQYPNEKLFHPLGIKRYVWEQDLSGTLIASSYLYLRPQDSARIGWLMLNNGKWKDEQIVSAEWIKYMRTQHSSFDNTDIGSEADNRMGHGAHLWLNIDQKKKGLPRLYQDAPESLYMALGHHGQMIAVFPEQNLVVVRNSRDKDGNIDRNKMFKLLLDTIEEGKK